MGTTPSAIKIVNNTDTDIITTSVSDVDNFDFRDTPNRPDRNLNEVSIDAKKSLERKADLFSIAKHCPFTITLIFQDKTEDTFRIDLDYATGCCHRFDHSKRSHIISHKVENKKIIITIENTAEQKQNEEAEELMRKAREAMRQKLYYLALEHLERAKTLANRRNTIQNIKSDEYEICQSYAEASFEDGLDLEEEQHAEKAQSKYDKAKHLFQRALNLVYDHDTIQMLYICDLKISGNKSFNRAVKLEDEAFKMIEKSGFEAGITKYETALNKYKEAQEKYAEGAKRRLEYFSVSGKVVEEHIEEISHAINNINNAQTLLNQLTKINFKSQRAEAREEVESVVRRRLVHY